MSVAAKGEIATSDRSSDVLGVRWVIAAFVVTRMLVLLAVQLGAAHNGSSYADAVSGWDSAHFFAIARDGYAASLDVAFFPGLPIALKLLSFVGVPMWLGGSLIAVVCSALATWGLLRLYGAAAACLWLVAPMTVFTTIPYTEAPFCAAAFWAWERAQKGKWWQAAILCALACTLRVSGLFLIAGLGIVALTQQLPDAKLTWSTRIKNAAWLLIPAAVLVAYVIYLYTLTGTWSAWYAAQGKGWSRHLGWSWDALRATWPMTSPDYWPGRPEVPIMFRFEIVAVVIGWLTMIVAFLRRRWGEGTWAAANIVPLSSSGWFMSVNRAVLLLFPLFAYLGELLGWTPKGRAAQVAWRALWVVGVAVSLTVMVWWAWTFGRGGWAS